MNGMTFDWGAIIENLKGVSKETISDFHKTRCKIYGNIYPCETIEFEEL